MQEGQTQKHTHALMQNFGCLVLPVETAVDSDRFKGQNREIKFLSLELVNNGCNKLYTNSILLFKKPMEKGDTTGKSEWFTTWPGCYMWHMPIIQHLGRSQIQG